MTGIRFFKDIKVAGKTVKICDLSVEYVSRCQQEDGFDKMENALSDACELSFTLGEVGYKAGQKIYEEIIKHTFGEAKSEDSENAKK